jgi:hypothetical protein
METLTEGQLQHLAQWSISTSPKKRQARRHKQGEVAAEVSSRERIKRQKKEEKQRKQIEMQLRSIPVQEIQEALALKISEGSNGDQP